MNLAEAEFRKGLLQRLITFLQILQVHLLTLLDEREDDVNLSAQLYLVTDALVETRQLVVELMKGSYGLSAWRQLVYYAYIQVSINGHGEGARDRGGCHYQHMRRIGTLCP